MSQVQSFIPADFYQKIQDSAAKQAASMLRELINAAKPHLLPYIPLLIGILFIALIIASVKAMWGQTGMLGSLLYHIFYFGILGIIVWIKGLEIFFNGYFDLITLALYPFCYWLVGLILQKFKYKFRNRY